MPTVERPAGPPASAARDRLLATAADLFYREGIHSVGVDRILAAAGVTRATMYRHFAGKDAMVVAYLEREDGFIKKLFADAAAGLGEDPDPLQMLRLVIDGIAADATRLHTRGCPFINASAEYPDPSSPVRRVVAAHRSWFRATLTDVARAAGIESPDQVAAELVLLRDAMLIGNYLDGGGVEETFRTAALQVCGR